jgi:EAL domain-containing protein (putative c-di-GMP-specific phosphodiesterase class I)
MVKVIIDLAKNFGLDVIAEGVETYEQPVFLKESGCRAYQGYLFAKPLLVQDIEIFLTEESNRVTV